MRSPLRRRGISRRSRRMIPEEKLDQIRARFEFLEARLNAGAAVADLPALSREYAELKPVVEAIDRWRGLAREEAEAERLLADPEMRALAQEELERLRAALPEAERAVQLALLPQGRGRRAVGDPRDPRRHRRRGGGALRRRPRADVPAAGGGAGLALGGGRGGADRARRLPRAGGGDLGEGGLRGAEVRVGRAPGAAGAGDRVERADPYLGGDGGGAARGRGGGRGDPGLRTSGSTPCARRARAGST